MRVSSDDCQRPKYKYLLVPYIFLSLNVQWVESSKILIIAGVQGTCKYGTRVDYILASPNSPYKFVPGSYSVFSSKGTSDHHIVKVDIVRAANSNAQDCVSRKQRQPKQKVVRITKSSPSRGIWKTNIRNWWKNLNWLKK